ncbi:MAG: hypothetical protein ACKVIR_06760, partial [Candidatus Poseidoniales archaeon]
MADESWQDHLVAESEGLMRIKRHGKMAVDAMLVADEHHLSQSSDDRSLNQLVNIASMPGVVGEA